MSILKEFKNFALKGNVIDLAIGVIIGGAFGSIVSSLVNDIIMPFMGILTGGYNISHLSIMIGEAELKYGMFLQAVINFLIIAFSLFIVIRAINKAMNKKKEEEKAPAPPKTEVLLEEIRDLLKNVKN